jgi:putative membrane protein
VLSTAGAAFGMLGASAQDADQANFLADAIRSDIAEVKLADLARERAQSQQVRELGEMLSKDHTKSLQKLSGLADEQGVAAATELTPQQQKQYEALSQLSGTEFDATFLSQMVRGHQEAIAKFSVQAQKGSDPEVMALATEALPTLKTHLEQAQSLQKNPAPSTQSPTRASDSPSDSRSSR